MKRALTLGRIAGVRVQVHWTFLLLILWIIFSGIWSGTSTAGIFWSNLFVIVLFGCVVLHELGHALSAKQFGISTKEITLLPIGGVASLEDIPEEPREELLITLAGPVVNIVIAFVLYLVIPFDFIQQLDESQVEQFFSEISARNFLFLLFYANVLLAAFNFIPAFPMDGGRILRALLSMRMDRVQATQIAANLGQLVAVIFFFFGLLYNPFLALIGVFVFFGAFGENVMVQQLTLLRGYKAKDAMMTNITVLNPNDSVESVIDLILSGTERDFIVTNSNGNKPVGIVYNQNIIKAMKGKDSSLTVKDIMNSEFDTVPESEELTAIYRKMQSEQKSFLPVTDDGRLTGAIDRTNINEFMVFKSSAGY
ncbi:MAG: site-2 protease family protein [Bacteroidota bacterium]